MMASAHQPLDLLQEAASSIQSAIGLLSEPPRVTPGCALANPASIGRHVRLYQRTRRLRDLYFPPTMFADGCWDVLLDLYAAHQEKGVISVSSVCIAAAVPPTTALRQIGLLARAGLIDRHADPFDRRRTNLELSEAGLHAMQDYFAAVAALVALDGSLR